LGVVVVPGEGVDEEELFLAAADAGADDVEADGDVFQVTSAPESLAAVRGAIEAAGFAVESAELSLVPRTTTTCRTSTRTSTSPSRSWRPSRARLEAGRRRGEPSEVAARPPPPASA